MKKIFVSYRREPDQYVAGNLCRELRRQFGDSQVLRDKESIEGGVSWKKYVLNQIDRNAILLVLIGRGWSDIVGADGSRRLDDPEDPIRLEIADALRDEAAVIPLLLENAQMPQATELPADIAAIAELNALKLRDGDWEADVAKIAQRLERLGANRIAGPDALPAPKRSVKAIWSLALVALVVISLINGENDHDTILGGILLSLVAFGLAGFALFDIKRRRVSGKGLVIAGAATSALALLGTLGLLGAEQAPVGTGSSEATSNSAAASAPATAMQLVSPSKPAPVTPSSYATTKIPIQKPAQAPPMATPAAIQGLPSGYGMLVCGCWGFNPAPMVPDARCASGAVRLNFCPGECPAGGSPYAYVCQ